MFHRSSQQIQSLFPFNKKVFKNNPNIKNNADSERDKWTSEKRKINKYYWEGLFLYFFRGINREVYVNET